MQLVRKSLTLLSGEAAARVLGILSFALLARALSLADFGTLSFAMSTALMVGVLIDMGQNSHLSRMVARNPGCASDTLSRALVNKAALGGLAAVAVSAVFLLFGFSHREVLLVALMGGWATILSMLDSMRSVARAMDLMALDSTVNGLESLARLGAVGLAWTLGAGILGYAIAYLVEAVVACGLFALVLFRHTGVRLVFVKMRDSRGLLGESWALGVMALAMAGFYRVDQIIVQGLAGAAANGLYGAATRVVFTATVGGSLVMLAAYPELSRAAASREGYPSVYRRVLVLALGVGAAAGAVVFLAADPIVTLLYGDGYSGAVPLLRILSLVIIANSLTLVGMYSASALGRERRSLFLAAAMIFGNLAGNLWLVPKFGAVGAAWMSVVGEVVMASGMVFLTADMLLKRGAREGIVGA